MTQVLNAVSFLHRKGIIHRDIKPANIFISNENNYKIGDFGSCTYRKTQEFLGTLDYAAPEILTHKPYSEKVDLWSIGCVAYEMFTNSPPFFH